jgi:hypothetical protein
MTCKCGSKRIISVNGKTSDMCQVRYAELDVSGYVPKLAGIDTPKDGYGDYVQYSFCADCGQMRGKFPLSDTAIRNALGEMGRPNNFLEVNQMTCIVQFPTKKAFKERVMSDPGRVYIEDPSIFQPRYFHAVDMAVWQREVVTNHPKRSWFAQITRTATGFKVE